MLMRWISDVPSKIVRLAGLYLPVARPILGRAPGRSSGVVRIEQAPHWLAGHLGNHVVVAVHVQHLGPAELCCRGDDQVRDRAPVTVAGMCREQPRAA